jgi:hypothetical protein
LNYKDMEMLTALLKNVCKTRSVHILADSSKRDVERHAIQVTFWDDEKDQPVTVTVALAVVADASSTALAKLTLSALLTAGVTFEHTIESPFSTESERLHHRRRQCGSQGAARTVLFGQRACQRRVAKSSRIWSRA